MGGSGLNQDTIVERVFREIRAFRVYDGPTEVHKITVAKQLLKNFHPDNDLFPSYHLPKVRERAKSKHPDLVEELRAEWANRAQSIDAL